MSEALKGREHVEQFNTFPRLAAAVASRALGQQEETFGGSDSDSESSSSSSSESADF